MSPRSPSFRPMILVHIRPLRCNLIQRYYHNNSCRAQPSVSNWYVGAASGWSYLHLIVLTDMIMNVKGLMQAEWLTGDGWLFELYTISNILYQVSALYNALAAFVACRYSDWAALDIKYSVSQLAYLPSLPLPFLTLALTLLLSDKEGSRKMSDNKVEHILGRTEVLG